MFAAVSGEEDEEDTVLVVIDDDEDGDDGGDDGAGTSASDGACDFAASSRPFLTTAGADSQEREVGPIARLLQKTRQPVCESVYESVYECRRRRRSQSGQRFGGPGTWLGRGGGGVRHPPGPCTTPRFLLRVLGRSHR